MSYINKEDTIKELQDYLLEEEDSYIYIPKKKLKI